MSAENGESTTCSLKIQRFSVFLAVLGGDRFWAAEVFGYNQ